MTTKANKHGLRAAAKERSNKHAQRTPLPPRAGKVQDAKNAIAESAAILAEPRHNPLNPGGASVSAILDAFTETAQSAGDGPDAKSWGKAKTFAALAATAKWSVATEARGDAVEVTATRGSETIVQAWRGGVWQYDASAYAFGDRTTRPRNASGATKLLSRSAEDATAEMAKVASNRHFRKAEPKDLAQTLEAAQKSLPFDPELATDAEILTRVAGASIAWFNRLSRKEEAGIVGRGKQLRMTFNEDGARVLNFCCPVTGYRSLLVSAILRVGSGRVEAPGAESQKVLVDA